MNKKITIVRDLKEFYELRDALYKKWKGLYVPPLPTQKMFEEVEAVRFILEGDKDDRYYNEKVVFLQQFFNKVVPLKYIQESVELIAFLTESMPYEKILAILPKESPKDVAKRYKEAFPSVVISNETINDLDLSIVIKYCDSFEAFIKQVITIIESNSKFKNSLAEVGLSYFSLLNDLSNFEKVQILEGVNYDTKKLLLAREPYPEMLKSLYKSLDQMVSPFRYLDFWAKEEQNEITTLRGVYKGLQEMIKYKNDLVAKIIKDKEDLAKIQQGKLTMKKVVDSIGSLFQKPKDKQIEDFNAHIKQSTETLNEVSVTCKISCDQFKKVLIPAMQKRQLEKYYYFMKTFSLKQKDYLGSMLHMWEAMVKDESLA